MAEQQSGWYPDPAGDTSKLRYWNGSQWTGDYCEAPVPQPATVVAEDSYYSQPVAGAQIPTAQPIYVQTAAQPTNGLAIAALVLGIAGLCSGTIIPSIVAIIVGVMAKKHPGGSSLATAGLILGIVSLALWLLLWTLFGIGLFAALTSPAYYYSSAW